tara:strand:+ start:4992 stop:5966 length:975 start_codon:yes stop_codon:yes gene_type:complete
METKEQAILQRISVARGTAEPEQSAPTEEPKAVNVSDEAPIEADAAINEPVVTDDLIVSAAEIEEEEASDEPVTTEADSDEDLYATYNGREINLREAVEWEQGNLRQSDYTKKTQELSEQRKTFDADKEALTSQHANLQGSIATLEAIIAEETLSAEDIAELREYEPDAYIKYTEKISKRDKALTEAKSTQPVNDVNIEAERKALWDANPLWMKDGKQTEAFTNDMKLLTDFAQSNGYSEDEISSIKQSKHWQTLIKAAKFDASATKNAAIEKKVRTAPVSTRPKQVQQTSLVTEIKEAEAKLKKTGHSDDAIKLRQLRRKAAG